ncbi:amino acid permease, partial [Streptomyces sp. BE308]|uniref:amino acid permease n=1 Tax=Streptomyces sp. BE308 TaxID=3002529 RepID=UPI002E768C8B
KAIDRAGPSLILAYAIAGLVIFFIMRALGELLRYRPVSGSFSEYAREFLGPFFVFVTGWTYWLFGVVTGTAIYAAAGNSGPLCPVVCATECPVDRPGARDKSSRPPGDATPVPGG